MSPPISADVYALVRSLFEKQSLLDRFRGQDRRLVGLAELAASGEFRVVPHLLPLLATDEALAPHVGRTVAELVRGVTPAQLAWLDEQIRGSSTWYYGRDDWSTLAPDAVSRLAQSATLDAAVIGLIASHPNGYVRATALEALAHRRDGQALPFLSLRANDWVDPVAARARELLIGCLRPDNQQAVLTALPFIVRVLGQRRHDHRDIERALRSVLLSDGGEEALARTAQFDISVRRIVYELLLTNGLAPDDRFLDVALRERDAVIRARAIRAVAAGAELDHRVALLERLLRDDPVPSIRKLVLTLLSERLPDRIGRVFPDVLLDRAARVRDLARFVGRTHQLSYVPRDTYLQGLASSRPGQVTAAIAGVGETGTREDAELMRPYLGSMLHRNRRTSLRALGKLDAERAIPSAIAALADITASVRSVAVEILSAHAASVDFEVVSQRVRSLPDSRIRRDLLRVFMSAPKWEGVACLLEGLTDSDDAVRVCAARLVDRWLETFNRKQIQPTANQLQRIRALLDVVAPCLPVETARGLRFSLKPL